MKRLKTPISGRISININCYYLLLFSQVFRIFACCFSISIPILIAVCAKKIKNCTFK